MAKNETNFSSTEMIKATFYPWSTKQVVRVAHVFGAQTSFGKRFTFSKSCAFSPLQGLHTEKNVMILGCLISYATVNRTKKQCLLVCI